MEVKTKAIVLRTVKYGESRIIVDLLTREAGRVSMVCQLTKSGNGKIKKQLLQPMTMLDVAFDYRKNISLQHFQDLRIGQVYRSLLFDPYKLSITLFLAEFLIYATRDETDNRQLYDFIETSLLWLDNADGGFANFHLVFMLRISLFIGFYPNLDDYHEGCWFDLREGCFTPLRPSHNDCLKRSRMRRPACAPSCGCRSTTCTSSACRGSSATAALKSSFIITDCISPTSPSCGR